MRHARTQHKGSTVTDATARLIEAEVLALEDDAPADEFDEEWDAYLSDYDYWADAVECDVCGGECVL